MSVIENMQTSAVATNNETKDSYELNVTLLEPKQKHPTIFKLFDALAPGESFCVLNDHDPKPLYYQFIAERGNVFTWDYEESGPIWWRVIIQKNNTGDGPTLGELAAADIRKAEVFKKYGLDFCCGGKKSLKQACEEKSLDVSVIEKEMNEASKKAAKTNFNFDKWQLDFLADYIYNEHHQYWYNEEKALSELMDKVAEHHGTNHPELIKIRQLFKTLHHELNTHFMKEERVLFPHIKQLAKAKQTAGAVDSFLTDINQPLQMMEADHEAAGELLTEIRKATNDYTLPEDACNSFALLYNKLEALEEDLHQHIHLENNILFPKAAKLHKELIRA